MASCLPLLVVFDLDYTLWPFWVDTHVQPPFRKDGNKVVDAHRAVIKHYKDSPKILEKLHSEYKIQIGVASRTSAVQEAKRLIELFGWKKYFSYTQIYPGSKIPHFNEIKKQSGIDFSQMIFFDDEQRNIRDVETLGVFCVFVHDGMTMKLLEDSFKQFKELRCKDL